MDTSACGLWRRRSAVLVASEETGLDVNAGETKSVVLFCERNARQCQRNKSSFDASRNWKQPNCVNSLSCSVRDCFYCCLRDNFKTRNRACCCLLV